MSHSVFRNIHCVNGRLMRCDPQPDDPSLETDIGVCPDCHGRGCELPKVLGLYRIVDAPENIVSVVFDKRLTDDEFRDFHEYCKEWVQ